MIQNYNAGITSYALWFSEFKLCVSMYQEGNTLDDIKQASDNNNVLEMPSRDRAKRASRNLTKRLKILPENIINQFEFLDVNNQKLVALLSIMLTNRLLNEFVYEVYRNEIILGDKVLEEREMIEFITRKQMESEQIAKWTDETSKRVRGSLKTILRDAGLLKREKNIDIVLQPFIDIHLAKLMKQDHLNKELTALGGQN